VYIIIRKADIMKPTSFMLISGVSVALYTACAKETPITMHQEQAIYVKAETLIETTDAMPIQCSGILSSKHLIKLSFKTGGIIARINVSEGSQVKKGQVMAALDMTEISSQVGQAKLIFEKADRDLKRVKSLFNDTVATLEQLQDATSAYEAALENNNIAEFNQRYSRIAAPTDGKIIAKLAEEHELIGPGMPVLVFGEQGKDEWIVKAAVSDKEIISIKNGDKAEAVFDAYPGLIFSAFVSQVSEAADPLSGTFEVEITINPGNKRLINGLVAKVIIESLNKQCVTLVPAEAVTEADGRKGFVYIVETADTTARRVPVTIVYLQHNSVAVIEPLNKIGPVITKGASYLEDGLKVSISK
jgi:multidrug efflux system membrane fusion protein